MEGIKNRKKSVVMLPFLAHGHISTFCTLAKHLAKRNFNIYICSTPVNLNSIKKRIPDKEISVHLVELHLPSSPELPPHYHTTNGLPLHLMITLQKAFEMAAPSFTTILKNINPDLVIYDFQPSWPAEIALSLNIPAVYFITMGAATASVFLHVLKRPGLESPFPEIFGGDDISKPETVRAVAALRYYVACVQRSCKVVLVKSFREIEGKYIDYFSDLAEKDMIPVGPLVAEPIGYDDVKTKNIMEWLDKKGKCSVVYVCFGSENYLSKNEVVEMADALESSKVSFIWALRFPKGEEKWSLPEGFIERVGELGLVLEGWAPQTMILGHESIGGFVSHCGRSSVMESMKFGVPVIGMPIRADQPRNAKLAVDIGIGMEVLMDEEGKFSSQEIGKVIRKVMVEKSGEAVRRKAKELSLKMMERGEDDLDRAAEELMQICRK